MIEEGLTLVERRCSMEDVIRKIIKIEEKAQAIMATTIQENEAKKLSTEEYVSTLRDKIIGDAEKKAKELRKRELGENAAYAKEIKGKCDQRLVEMVEKAQRHEEEWIAYLVDKVLGD